MILDRVMHKKLIVNLLSIIILSILCASHVQADVTELNNDELEELRAAGVAIIDVRRPDEWSKTGIVEGSYPLMFFDAKGRYDVNQWLSELDKVIRKDQPVVLICARGVRSLKIANLLDKRLDYSAVHNVTDGILKWLSDGREVVEWKPD